MKTTLLLVGVALVWACSSKTPVNPPGPHSSELENIFREDQADRQPLPGGRQHTQEEFLAVGARDLARLKRVKDIYRADGLHQPRDFYLAGTILQHSWDSTTAADDHLLAHELAIIAFAAGVPGAGYLVAASEDRFLTDDLGRTQRFGTQFGGGPFKVGDVITDSLRARYGVPRLAQLRARGGPHGSPP